MTDAFFDEPILNSPYEYPARHWELDASGQPTSAIIDARRSVKYVAPVPGPKKRGQAKMVFEAADGGFAVDGHRYGPTPIINAVRITVDQWRREPDSNLWGVTPETARLLKHWRHHEFANLRPFFCQVEAVEMAPGFAPKSNAK